MITQDQSAYHCDAMEIISENKAEFDQAIELRGVVGFCAILRTIADIIERDEAATGRLH